MIEAEIAKAIDRKLLLLASIERIARSYEPALRDAFLAAVRSARSNASIEAIAEAIQSMNPGQAIRAATAGLEYDRMRDTLADIIEAAGDKTTTAIATEVGPVRGVQIAGFDVVNPYAVGYARTEVGRLIRGIDMRTREGIQNLIGNAIETGIAPREAARTIRGMVGLTEYQTDYVMNYQQKLIAEGASNIEGKVQRYADKVLRQRALTISRSETLRASNAGQQAAWRAAIDQGFLDSDVEQVWIVTADSCEEICLPMPDMEQNQHVGIGGKFLTGDGSYVSQPPAHPNCLTPDVEIEAIERESSLRVPFRGWVNVIEAGRRRLTIGPNHPVLTTRGFIPAHLLNEGDQVFCGSFGDRKSFAYPNEENGPATIQQIFESFCKSRLMSSIVMPAAAEYLHGDGLSTYGEIEIVNPYGPLRNQDQSRSNDVQQLMFESRDSSRIGFGSKSASPFLLIRMYTALRRLVSSFDLLGALHIVHGLPFNRFCLRLCAWLNSTLNQFAPERRPGHSGFSCQNVFAFTDIVSSYNFLPVTGVSNLARTTRPAYNPRLIRSAQQAGFINQISKFVVASREFIGESAETFTGDISPTRIGKVKRLWYSGHVYDLQAFGGLYFANGILASNCRCRIALNV